MHPRPALLLAISQKQPASKRGSDQLRVKPKTYTIHLFYSHYKICIIHHLTKLDGFILLRRVAENPFESSKQI